MMHSLIILDFNCKLIKVQLLLCLSDHEFVFIYHEHLST
jgi:hypothetical protein